MAITALTSSQQQNITVIGDGGWGTTLALHLLRQGHHVTLWGPFAPYIKEMQRSRRNTKFLPKIPLPKSLLLTHDLKQALNESTIFIYAIPSQYTPAILQKIKKTGVNLSKKLFCSVTKGLDTKTLLRISQMVEQHLGNIDFAILSGPTIAPEVAKGLPSTAVVAAKKKSTSKKIQDIFHSDTFRIYTSNDIIGVELGGSIKNVIAIACGVCDGLDLGTNTKAAVVTRGLDEMAQLGLALGAKQNTFTGLSGLGDLVTTCFSPKSRNRSVGERLGKGQSLSAILSSMDMVAEGVETVKAIYKLSRQHHIDMPITTEVYHLLYNNKSPQQTVCDLMARERKAE